MKFKKSIVGTKILNIFAYAKNGEGSAIDPSYFLKD